MAQGSVAEKQTITDQGIVALYLKGYSQRDITEEYKVAAARTRSVLKEAGFNTRSFRSMSEVSKQIIRVLAVEGVYYNDIEAVTDLSVHAIREYVSSSKIGPRSAVPPHKVYPTLESFEARDLFLDRFLVGESFSTLAEDLHFTDRDILNAYFTITEETCAAHAKALKERILRDFAAGFSCSGIARKNGVSRSIVKKYLKPGNK